MREQDTLGWMILCHQASPCRLADLHHTLPFPYCSTRPNKKSSGEERAAISRSDKNPSTGRGSNQDPKSFFPFDMASSKKVVWSKVPIQ